MALVPNYGRASEVHSRFRILSPANHAELSSYPVEIKLEFPEGSTDKQFRAELNGVDVTRRFGPLTQGTRRAIFYRRNLNLGSNSFTVHDGSSIARVHFTVRLGSGLLGSSSTLGNWVLVQTPIRIGNPNQLSAYGIQVGSDTLYRAPNITLDNHSANGQNGLTGFQVLAERQRLFSRSL